MERRWRFRVERRWRIRMERRWRWLMSPFINQLSALTKTSVKTLSPDIKTSKSVQFWQ